MSCTGLSATSCCQYYSSDMCVDQCPGSLLMPNAEFDCVCPGFFLEPDCTGKYKS